MVTGSSIRQGKGNYPLVVDVPEPASDIFNSDMEIGDKLIRSGELQGIKIHFFSKSEIRELFSLTDFEIVEFLNLKYPDEDKIIVGPKAAIYTGGFIVKVRKCIIK